MRSRGEAPGLTAGLGGLAPPTGWDDRTTIVVLTCVMLALLAAVVVVALRSTRRLERDHQKLRAELEAVFDHTPAALSLRGVDGRFIRVNKMFVEHTGLDVDAVVGRPMEEVYPPELLDWATDQIRQVLERRQPISDEITIDLGQGERVFEAVRFPVFDAAGDPIAVGTFSLDITERRAAENSAGIAAARVRAFLDSAPDPTIVVDHQGLISYANQRITELLGYQRSELIGRSVDQLVPEHLRSEHARLRDMYAQHPTAREMGAGAQELVALHKDGTSVPVEISLSPVRTAGGTFVAAAVRDVTRRRAVEKALREAEQRARELSHRDPLTGGWNRRWFDAELRLVLGSERDLRGALFFVDIDHFKNINDSLGHDAGDRLLVAVMTSLTECLPAGGSVSRIGGDEFAVLIVPADADQVRPIGDLLVAAVRGAGRTAGIPVAVTGSVGAVPLAELPDRQPRTALVRADEALYRAKAAGRDRLEF